MPFYKGGPPDDLPEGIDLWLWGGLSLLTDEMVDPRLRRFRRALIVGPMLGIFQVSYTHQDGPEACELVSAILLCITLLMVLIVCCTTSWIDKAVCILVNNELNPKFRQEGFWIEYVVESSCWNRKTYYVVYRESLSSAVLTTVQWSAPATSSPFHQHSTIGSFEIFTLLAHTMMKPERRYQVAETIGLWNWGGVLEVVRRHVEPERETFYNAIESAELVVALVVIVLLLCFDYRLCIWGWLYVPLQFYLLEPALQRSLDCRFGERVQDALLEVGPEFRLRTNYELEYTGSSVTNNYKGHPVVWIVKPSRSRDKNNYFPS